MSTAQSTHGRKLLLTLALTPFIVQPAMAAKEPAAQVGEEMVVTASRTEQRSIDVPVDTQVISRETIEMSGVTDVGDLIGKYVTGHFHKYNGLLSPIGLRGFKTDAHGADLNGAVLLLIDGHRVGTGNAAKINLDRIERVEIIKGPASALYGSAAMGGVVNLITKKGDGKLGGSLGAEYGSFDYYKTQVSAGGEVNDKFRFFAAADVDDVDNYKDPTFGEVYNTGVEKKNIGGNFVYAFSDRHELRIGGNYSDLYSESSNWTSGEYSSYDPDFRDNSDKNTGYADMEYNGDFFGDTLHWKGMAYYLYDKNHWNSGNSNYAPDPCAYQTKYVDETVGTDNQLTWKMNRWSSLLMGFTVESLEKESSAVSAGAPATPYTPALDYDNQALFAQESLDLFDNRLNLVAAARYDRYDVTTSRAETGSDYFVDKSADYDHVSPKIGASVKFFDEKMRVRANLGEGFKSPTADQLAADYIIPNYWSHYIGNPDLEPETSQTYDVGVDFLLDPFTLKLGFFHTDWSDKISQEAVGTDSSGYTIYQNNNIGDAEISGFEIGLEWAAGKTLGLPFDASLWSNATINGTSEEDDGTEMKYVSDYEIRSGLDLRRGGASAQLSHALVGPQMIDRWVGWSSVVEEKSSFDYWDLTLRYRFAEHWEVKGSVLNLFDQEVEWVRGYLMPERNYRIGLTYNF